MSQLFLRPFRANLFSRLTQGLRPGLHSSAALRLAWGDGSPKSNVG